MSQCREMLVQTAERLFADLAATPDAPFKTVWARIEAAGFPLLLVPEEAGGFGGDWGDAFAVFRLAGFHALNAPLAEAVIARWAQNAAGLSESESFCTIAANAECSLFNGRFIARLGGAPWAASASAVIAEIDGQLMRLPLSQAKQEPRANLAGEPRCELVFDGAEPEWGTGAPGLFTWGAFARTAQIAGGLDAALGLSIEHANARVQFGRPIGKFQAVQQALAVFAEEAAAVNCAGQAAAEAADRGDAGFEIAAAKLRANRAAGEGVTVAHQVHGAIGFTREHALHRYSLRLSAWRTEFGNDRLWSTQLGACVARLGADQLWPELTRRSEPA